MPGLTCGTFLIEGGDPGVRLHLRNQAPAGVHAFAAERIVLFVHGATYPGSVIFDIGLPGGSWLEYAARRGFDAYCLDVRGYGGSTRPAAMDQPPEANPPFAMTVEAIRDVAAAVAFICRRRAVERISLVGHSWGTAIAGGYAAGHNQSVEKLVLFAPVWTSEGSWPISGAGAYRTVHRDEVRVRGLRGIPAGREEEISPTPWFDHWWEQVLATDLSAAQRRPPGVRAPNGVIHDLVERWSKGQPTWDPAAIRVPSLVVVGEWDQDTPPAMAEAVLSRLVNAPRRAGRVLSEGTHAMALERNRLRLFEQVQEFLDG